MTLPPHRLCHVAYTCIVVDVHCRSEQSSLYIVEVYSRQADFRKGFVVKGHQTSHRTKYGG